MKLLDFGASGGCGRRVASLGLDRGHEVSAVVRPDSTRALPTGVRAVKGQVLDRDFVRSVVEEDQVIVSTLGIRRAGPSPWAKLESPPDLVARAMTNLTRAVRDRARIVWISAGGVGVCRALTSMAIRRLIQAGNVGVAYRDLEAAERVMERAAVDSIAVRPVTLRGGPATGCAGAVSRYGLFSLIRRSDAAEWMLNVADGTTAFDQASILVGRWRRSPCVPGTPSPP